MAKKKSEPTELARRELEIMEVVWKKGEASVADVRKVLLKKRAVARNTIRTVMGRMEQKGWLNHREAELKFIYFPAHSRETLIGRKVSDLVDTLCGGDPEALILALVEHRGLGPDVFERNPQGALEGALEPQEIKAEPKRIGKPRISPPHGGVFKPGPRKLSSGDVRLSEVHTGR